MSFWASQVRARRRGLRPAGRPGPDALSAPQYDANPAVRMVFIRGRGPKVRDVGPGRSAWCSPAPPRQAFCAGGDIKQLWRDGQRPETRDRAIDFFAKEYYLNYTLATSNKAVRAAMGGEVGSPAGQPRSLTASTLAQFVGCLDGITMGGGVGIGAHCKVRGRRTALSGQDRGRRPLGTPLPSPPLTPHPPTPSTWWPRSAPCSRCPRQASACSRTLARRTCCRGCPTG